jgi:hypothetical protein
MLSSDSGFSLLEMMVAAGLGLLVTFVALSQFQSTQRMVRYDIERTTVNQNLRTGLDIIGMNVRLAGENLPGFFPAIVLEDNGTNDTLIIRRSLLDENIVSCHSITAGTSTEVFFADEFLAEPSCAYGNKADVLASWSGSRVDRGGTGLGYLYDRVAHVGEFFEWEEEEDNLSQLSMARTDGLWANSYNALQSFGYVIEEWRFSLNAGTLQLIVDNDTENPINVVSGISAFNVQIELSTGTVVDAYAPGLNWSNIGLVEVSLTGTETSSGQVIERTVNGSFFPRNVLSN